MSNVKCGGRKRVPPGHLPIPPQIQYDPKNLGQKPAAAEEGRQRLTRSKSLETAVEAGTKHAAQGLARSTTLNSLSRRYGRAVGADPRPNDGPPNTSTPPTVEDRPPSSPTSQPTDSIGELREYGFAPLLPSIRGVYKQTENSERRHHVPRAVSFSEYLPRPQREYAKPHISVITDRYSWEDRFADPPEPAETNCEHPHGHANNPPEKLVNDDRNLSAPPNAAWYSGPPLKRDPTPGPQITESLGQFLERRGRGPTPFNFAARSSLPFAMGRYSPPPGSSSLKYGATSGFRGGRRPEASTSAFADQRGQFHSNHARSSSYHYDGGRGFGIACGHSFSSCNDPRKASTGDNPCPIAPHNPWKEAEQNWVERKRKLAEAENLRQEESDC